MKFSLKELRLIAKWFESDDRGDLDLKIYDKINDFLEENDDEKENNESFSFIEEDDDYCNESDDLNQFNGYEIKDEDY